MRLRDLALAVGLSLAVAATAAADTLGWWRFEGRPGSGPGNRPIGSEVNPKQMAGKAAKAPGETPRLVYAEDVPGPYIFDPATRSNKRNQASMRFHSGTETIAGEEKAVADVVEVPGAGGPLPRGFTIEGFIKHEPGVRIAQWTTVLVQHREGKKYPQPFGLAVEDWHPGGIKKMKMKLHPKGMDLVQPHQTSNPTVTEEAWHHFAYTYDPRTGEMKLYWDHELKTSHTVEDESKRVIHGGPEYALFIGGPENGQGHGWSGWLDEVRFSSEPLPPENFLRALDKPGRATTSFD